MYYMNDVNVSIYIILLALGTLIVIACLRGAPGVLETRRFKGAGVSAHVRRVPRRQGYEPDIVGGSPRVFAAN